MRRFLIKLKDAHEEKGLTAYAVAKTLNMNWNTVSKYVTAYVETETLPVQVIELTEFYGLDWRDPAVIEVIVDESVAC